ncbi:M4 family metallopeptidase [Streptomyces laurentii]|uniref:M4 family metallopeptidase n=1 Tax=Streptomyces laurentii TaxID=39478 RepID=UPI0036C8C827
MTHHLTPRPAPRPRVFCAIVPPHILTRLSESSNPAHAEAARRTLAADAAHRSARIAVATRSATADSHAGAAADADADSGSDTSTSADSPQRTIYDAQHRTVLPGKKVRGEGDAASKDASVNRAYAGLGATYDLYHKVFGRRSIDGAGMPLPASVHYDRKYDNAFWDGERMVFGDGDGDLFLDFTIPVDVIGHELSHGFTQHTANLAYYGQSGALNESVSDVFGSLVKQYALGQTAADADWLIGEGLLGPAVDKGVALRSMKAPGTAYDDDVLGKDPQPATMDHYVRTGSDNGGVHVNSGIPNHAFYLLATELGGSAWERAGRIWYDVMTGGTLSEDATFAEFARATVASARTLFGDGGAENEAVLKAWSTVGVPTS